MPDLLKCQRPRSASSSLFGSGEVRATAFEPSLQGSLTLSGVMSRQETFYTDVFVELGPVDSFSPPNKAPFLALRGPSVRKTRVPLEGHREGAPISEINYKHVFSNGDAGGHR
jgi:hypothetical protein